MLVSTNVTREGERMRGFVVARHAHPAEIELSYDVKEPKAAEGEVVVDVHSAGLNFADILQAQGQYQVQPPLPFVLGAEFSGRISPSSLPGTFADKVNVDVRRLYKLPDQLNFEEGAGLYVTWFTAYMAVVDRGKVNPVTASAGALGLACVQLAKAVGAKVIAAASLPYRLEIARRHGGADYTVNYSDPEWITEVRRITGGKGVDVAVDVVGNARDLLGCAAWKSRILVVGFAAGSIPKDHNEEERYLGWRLCQHARGCLLTLL